MFNIMHMHVMFRLVEEDASPHPPPKSATGPTFDSRSGQTKGNNKLIFTAYVLDAQY